MLKHAGVGLNPETNSCYSLKTVRALRATQWVKLAAEYKVMQWEPAPPNPLSHTNTKTTFERYAVKGADNVYEARNRCVEKYGSNPQQRQPWMDEHENREEEKVQE